MGKIVVIIGKSSSGKDTIYARVLEELNEYLLPIVLHTNRPMRPGEVEGETYFFVSDEGLDELDKQGKLIEERRYKTVNGIWRYATIDNGNIDLENNNYITINTLVALEKIRAHFGSENVIPIYLEIDDDTRIKRAVNREFETKRQYTEMCRRWLGDEADFSEENIKKANVIRIDNSKDINLTVLRIVTMVLPQITSAYKLA